MKLSAIAIAVVCAGIAGVASAAGPTHVLPQINVSPASYTDCTPPNGATGHACDAYDQFLRANFSSRQIAMLFGNRSSFPEYRTGGIDRLQRRYQSMLQQFAVTQANLNAASKVAVK